MNTTIENPTWIERARTEHHNALKAMLPAGCETSGLQLWRRLRRLERQANDMATRLCNGTISQECADRFFGGIQERVKHFFGGKLPPGFFINRDPRGYALKLEENSVPFRLHTDMGRYQILAPEIN